MSTKGITYAAPFAVVFVSNISLGDAAGAQAPPDIHDDFPPSDDEAIMQDQRGLDAWCIFGDGEENRDRWSPAMDIEVWNSGVLTNYEEKGQPALTFSETPPNDSGLDPLRDLDNPGFREMVAHLKNNTSYFFYARRKEAMRSYGILGGICMKIREAVVKRYGSIKNMCVDFQKTYKNALKAVDAAGWYHNGNDDDDSIRVAPEKLSRTPWLW
ncbi:hypothetical protein FOZ63_026158 [Perkinsus olseni]|uniref:Uncharacterized protein n=1 Tax=Perkinsus olseni TaxID=32597 RepID=A0A7J6T2P4_PEROL|nr:hypothetical protein FOZ60_014910 [Perkinsus olseni]KAF4739468.1 hypothetical protein FOZ63_026158 [Perkinsus olseni]